MALTVGLEIGGSAVRAAAVDSAKGGRILRRFAEMPLPTGAVVSGEVIDEGAVGEAIAALWKRHKLPTKRVIVGTANQRLVVRRVDVPQMDEAELAAALPYQVQDSIPIAVEDAILDFIPLEQFSTPEGEPMSSILVVAIHRETVSSLLRVTGAAKIRPEAIDLQAFGLVRATFGMEPAVDNPLQAVVDIGATLTQVVIARGGVAEFVRLLPRGGDDFTEALMDGMGLAREEAEESKRATGVALGPAPDASDDEGTKALRLLTRQADSLVEEIKGSIDFYVGQAGQGDLTRLVVSGNGARLPHLANRLGTAVGVVVKPAKILDHVDVGRVDLSEDEMLNAQPVLPTAVGLALWGMP
jgi:type IV pilus assembly protein PilM